MRHRILLSVLLAAFAVLLSARTSVARTWVEEDFWPREVKTYSFAPPAKPGPDSKERTVIGENLVYQPEKGDTFFDLARYFDLGYNEIQDANPGVDEWIPGHFDKQVVVPQQFVLPNDVYSGIVINVPEMRLYYYRPAGKDGPRTVITFPVGLGREEWKTPVGKFTVREKTVNPTWNIPESIRKERIADRGYSETMIPGGDPKNPLGKYRMRLTLDLYGIHGTNIPWGVGMLVSHGCVRLYPEDIEKFYPMIPVGTPGAFVYQPVKVGMLDGRVFVEVHKDLYGMRPGLYRETRAKLEQHGFMSLVDENKLSDAVLKQSGIPVDVTIGSGGTRVKHQQLQRADTPPRPAEIVERAPRASADDLETDTLRPVSGHLDGAPQPQADPPAARRPAGAAPTVLIPAEGAAPVRGRDPGATNEAVR